jgi:alpha-ribazole phosphatase
MIKLFLVRHGETDWNINYRFQGQTDVPLNEKGREQAEAITQRLASQEIQAIYASDLSRAWDTAVTIAANHKIEISPEPRLREASFGQWEGSTYAEILTLDPAAIKAWREDIANFSPPGGEILNQIAERVNAVYQEIIANHADQNILLVAHGGSLQILICLLIGLPVENFWQFNLDHCSLSKIFVYDEGAIINLLNDTSHLPNQPKGLVDFSY